MTWEHYEPADSPTRVSSDPRDGYRYDPRRFLVATERLAIYSGVYERGEVITDYQAGTACERLLEMGALVETDYDLKRISTGPEVL